MYIYIYVKSNILLGTDRNLTLLSLNTLVGKSFHLCQNLHPVILWNVGDVVIQRENINHRLSIIFPSWTYSNYLRSLYIHLISRVWTQNTSAGLNMYQICLCKWYKLILHKHVLMRKMHAVSVQIVRVYFIGWTCLHVWSTPC